jgi:hypothetical protein
MAENIREIDWKRVRAEIAGTIQAAREENITLISYNSDTGEAWRVSPDGTVEPYEIGPSLTDWARVNAMTDEEIEAIDTSDEGEPGEWLDYAETMRIPCRGSANGV